jgi:phospholipid/cholesterol/gamma-HCH transport system permease protein
MFLGIFGGWVAGLTSTMFSEIDYMQGVQLEFNPFLVKYALIKTLVFAFLIATVPSYHGYYVKGGSIAVGKASTQAVVWTIILIVIANYFLTQMLLT